MPRARPNTESKICEAALRLAAREGWSSLTLDRIAKAARIPPAQVKRLFAGKDRILPAIVLHIDARAAAAAGKAGPRASPHDRLLEAMMARFDVLQAHRAGILAILEDIRRDPGLARQIIPAQWRSMEKMAVQARLSAAGDAKQLLVVPGILGLYYATFCTWQRDPSPDMSKTMATLDRYLRRIEIISEILFHNK